MPPNKLQHFVDFIEDTDFVVLQADEFETLRARSEEEAEPQFLRDARGNVTHVVLFHCDYETLLSGLPEPDDVYTLQMDVKEVFAEAIVSFDPNEPWIKVYAGAVLGEVTSSLKKDKRIYSDRRQQLEDDGIVARRDGRMVLLQDYEFDNYSEAACILSGTSQSGNEVWIDSNGRTLVDRGIGMERGQARSKS